MRNCINRFGPRAICFAGAAVGILVVAGTTGCGNAPANIAIAATLVGGQAPSQEIEQVYYVGVLDPQEQLPPQVYRLTVHGQASAISLTRFASGWVPASMVDTLESSIGFDRKTGELTLQGKDGPDKGIETGRRLVMFGPEGFREAPRDHRLVIVMGSNPEGFFKAVGSGLATVAQAKVAANNDAARTLMLDEMLRVQRDQGAIKQTQADAADVQKGAQ
jgi:hypothetical protein